MNRIILLGTGTCQLLSARIASSALIELDGLRILFDIGRGVASRIAEHGLLQADLEHIVISHFHQDHISDLIPYLHAGAWSRVDPRSKDLHIYGPLGVEVQVMRILSLFGPEELNRSHYKIFIHELRGDELLIGNKKFDFISLPPANNHGLRFKLGNKIFALAADSYFHQELLQFLNGVDEAVFDAGHLTEDEIIDLAVKTQVNTLWCSHLYSELDVNKLNTLANKRGYQGELKLAYDKLILT